MRGAVEPGRELGDDLSEPAAERGVGDPVRPPARLLADRERDQAQPAHRDHPEGDLHRARPPVHVEQPQRLGHDDQRRVVVGGQCRRRGDHPRRQHARGRRRARVREAEQREAREQREQLVGAGLLGVPDQQRVARGQRGHDQSGPTGHELGAGEIHDRDQRHPGQRRQGAQPDLAVAEDPRPDPGHAVVERGSGLGLGDQPEHLARREMDQQRGVGLVEPEALMPQAIEAQDRAEHGKRCHRDDRGVGENGAAGGRRRPSTA